MKDITCRTRGMHVGNMTCIQHLGLKTSRSETNWNL